MTSNRPSQHGTYTGPERRLAPRRGTTFVNVPLTGQELSVAAAEAAVANFDRRIADRPGTPALPVPPSILESLARATKEELQNQLAALRLHRDATFVSRYGVGTSEEDRRAAEAADRLVLLRMRAVRQELASR